MSRLEFTILYLLAKVKEKKIDDLSKYQIMKLIYLLEIESRKFTGEGFIDSISFYRHDRGPISYDIYTALKNLENKNYIGMKTTKKPNYPYPRHGFSIKKLPKKIELDDSEKIFLNSVFESYIGLTLNKLGRVTYSSEPMKEILKEEQKTGKISEGSPLNLNSVSLDQEIVDLF